MFFYNTLKIDNIQGVDFKYGNVFFKFLPKNAKKGFFGPKFRHYFLANIWKLTNLRVFISNITIILGKF